MKNENWKIEKRSVLPVLPTGFYKSANFTPYTVEPRLTTTSVRRPPHNNDQISWAVSILLY